MILATGLFRATHLVGGAVAAIGDRTGLLLFGLSLTTSTALYLPGYRRDRLGRYRLWADALVTGCLVPVLALPAVNGPITPAVSWVALLGSSSAAAVAAGLDGRSALSAIGLVSAVHAACYLQSGQAAALGGHLLSLVSAGVMAHIFWRYLHRQGAMLDEARERALVAEAARARRTERAAQHRALHDTVLATLTAIVHERVDPTAETFRERCAREASYLRRLIQRSDEEEGQGGDLAAGAALEQAVAAAEGIGLTVHTRYHALPVLPAQVARALAAAVTEALNNVRHHAGTSTAHLTATGSGRGIVVTVADEGCGFDSSATTGTGTGTGLRRSVHGRMTEIGGSAAVDSAPGEGTLVELTWPA
ncbi:sensor histidine kinase [Kitasatospora sp. MMS16-BH015]|uniref:sensor histidine kinase n=1 Tax=Kitasatospora sp. MMS16-BH015 TaxID=2018025 RepID=UPI000CF27560|nr:ATP-binding protein [Kitasatospora sp. MMS16-BH015]